MDRVQQAEKRIMQSIATKQDEESKRLKLTDGIPLDRLTEICAAEKDGRCVVLPCPFYSEVYALAQVGDEIIHGELRSTNKDYCLVVNLEGNLTSKGKTWHGVQVRKEDVYLTREAAEAALKGATPNE